MFENLLNHQWLLAISLFVFMALAIELGYRTGIKFRIGDDQDRKEQINAIAQGLVVLLSLLLSFTLTMAVSRYDHRRELIVREADAIGTTYLRAATLGQPYQGNVEQLLRNYVDARTRFLRDRIRTPLSATDQSPLKMTALGGYWDDLTYSSLIAPESSAPLPAQTRSAVERASTIPPPDLLLNR